MSQDFAKLTAITSLIDPRLVFVDDAKPFARAVAAITGHHDFDLVAVRNLDAAGRRVFPFSSLMEGGDANAVQRAFADIQPETIAKISVYVRVDGRAEGRDQYASHALLQHSVARASLAVSL